MARSRFDPNFSELPEVLPLFPLPGGLLLPGGRLPLNIFEPRYLAMIQEAMKGMRLIGMVQPQEELDAGADAGAAPLFAIGCAGRIVAFEESEEEQIFIALSGLIRFAIREELPLQNGYRRAKVNWSDYRQDLTSSGELTLDRPRFLSILRRYFAVAEIEGNWETIRTVSSERLITSLAMVCPFKPGEKQALLEAATMNERVQAMIAFMELATLEQQSGQVRH